MITEAAIRRVAPRARQDYVEALLNGKEVFDKYGINTPVRLAHFLAQIVHESGGLTISRENMDYTARRIRQVWPTRPEAAKFANNPQGLANCVYNGRMGNRRGSDDGWRFRGGGLLQTTGRWNYETIGKAIGVDLGERPELIEDAMVSLKAAAHEFSKFISYCDMGERGLRAVSNGINRGNAASSLAPIGWEDRQLCFQKAMNALSIPAIDNNDGILEVGDHGEEVEALQKRLAALNYPVGKIDGVFGSRVRAAVLAYQAENGLSMDGKAGPKTLASLASETAVAMPLGDRATATKEEVRAAIPELKATDAVKTLAKAGTTAATTFAVADQTGLLDSGAALLSDLQQYQGVVSGIASVLHWALTHWYYFVPLLCYLAYRWASTVEGQAVLKFRLGLDLSSYLPATQKVE
jgi:putative chitinase